VTRFGNEQTFRYIQLRHDSSSAQIWTNPRLWHRDDRLGIARRRCRQVKCRFAVAVGNSNHHGGGLRPGPCRCLFWAVAVGGDSSRRSFESSQSRRKVGRTDRWTRAGIGLAGSLRSVTSASGGVSRACLCVPFFFCHQFVGTVLVNCDDSPMDPFLLAGTHAPAELSGGRCWMARRKWVEWSRRHVPEIERFSS
jgi:hypothetical protein